VPLKVVFILLGVISFSFTLNFFRDPDRITPDIPGAIISPADGKVVSVGEVEETEFIEGKALQVCIFMSPLNVHVNRYPVSGTVKYLRHIQGKYLVAFEDKSSDVNERTLIGIDTGDDRILFKQIAGFVARRIVCPIREGDTAKAGERFGMIKFGSRVDVLMPTDAMLRVKVNDLVVAGETVIAELPERR
jgi:phosphatidylserine decarboxylase